MKTIRKINVSRYTKINRKKSFFFRIVAGTRKSTTKTIKYSQHTVRFTVLREKRKKERSRTTL